MQLVRTALAAASAALAAPSPSAAFPPPRDRGPAVVPCSADRITLTATARLDPSCVYTGGIDITASNVALDCRGAVIDGTGKEGTGIQVQAPADADLSRVVIRNCVVRGFLNSIRVTREGFRALPAGHEYDHGIRRVVIERTQVSGSRGVGIYVDGYVTDTTIRRSTITGAGSSGIYLEAGSARNMVAGNTIHDNGFRENGSSGSLINFRGLQFRFWGIGREGISVDGSRQNLISGNTFEGNSAGGIFLYTNCGEYVRSRPERWFPRRYGADDNLIVGNRFAGGVNGVWVGSRMGENILPMECSDPAYTPGYALDRAARTTVALNSFRDVTYGVRVEDDDTRVLANRFSGPDATHHAVVVGTPQRTSVLGKPVRGTALVLNTSTIAGNPDPYRWVEGQTRSVVAFNRALGRPASLCQGKRLPRGPFVMTLAVAVKPPGAPVTPAPDLTVPTVGALPPC